MRTGLRINRRARISGSGARRLLPGSVERSSRDQVPASARGLRRRTNTARSDPVLRPDRNRRAAPGIGPDHDVDFADAVGAGILRHHGRERPASLLLNGRTTLRGKFWSAYSFIVSPHVRSGCALSTFSDFSGPTGAPCY